MRAASLHWWRRTSLQIRPVRGSREGLRTTRAMEQRVERRTTRMRLLKSLAFLAVVVSIGVGAAQSPQPAHPAIELFLQAASPDQRTSKTALDEIGSVWRDSYTPLIVDLARLMRPSARPGSRTESEDTPPPDSREDPVGRSRDPFRIDPVGRAGSPIRARLIRLLERKTRQPFADDLNRWRQWMWTLPYDPHPDYARFKGLVYEHIDPRMRAFFSPGVPSRIRLDEIDWGGVTVNGIPPLDHPKHIAAGAAGYLKDHHLVFGVSINGESRAYPKRILAWHELARDALGGVELTIVYCTLCGTVIPYESEVGGKIRRFGTSGLLYRSNKLMFDEETMSLWSSLEGAPVVGRLVDKGLQLRAHPVVTTTWREWREEHPDTTVLSIETGHERDYSEGQAYRGYFATDDLMFRVSAVDHRLKNKAEVLAMHVASRERNANVAVAVSAEFLARTPIYHLDVAGSHLVIITTPGGANRVYQGVGTRFVRVVEPGVVEDAERRRWVVTEEALVQQNDSRVRSERVSAHRAFWFGWYAQFPDTVLITR